MKAKTVAAFLGGIVLAGVIGAAAVGSSWFTNPDMSKWFNSWGKGNVSLTLPGDVQNKVESHDNAVLTDVESRGMSLLSTRIALAEYDEYGIDAQSVDSVYDLSVTYIPAETTFQDTTYTIDFANKSSSWATGKVVTDYATVTQPQPGSKNAQLQILQAFSEPIVVKATCDRHPDIYTTATVNYVCTTVELALQETTFDSQAEFYIKSNSCKWSNGTVSPESVDTITFVADLGEEFVNFMKAKGFTVNRYITKLLDDDMINYEGSWTSFSSMVYEACPSYNSLTAAQKADYKKALGLHYGEVCGHIDSTDADAFRYGVIYNRIYEGKDYGAFNPSDLSQAHWLGYVYCTGMLTAFEIPPTGMTNSNSSIIAG